jgi:hypothetical protein
MQNGQYTRTNGAQADQSVWPRFFVEAVQDEAATASQGRPIFREVEMVEIIIAGNPYTRPVKRVTDEHRERWPELYKQFKAGQEQILEGTPIEEWPALTKAQALELKAIGVHTVEQVASLSDLAKQRIGMGGSVLQQKAQAFLEAAEGMAPMDKLIHDNELLNNKVSAQEHQIGELNRIVEGLQAQLKAFSEAPQAPQTIIPGTPDAARFGAPVQPAGSSLDALAATPRRGRPRKTEAA